MSQADDQWAAEFYKAHGRPPVQQDVKDRDWSRGWAATHGRAPTQADWEAHYYGTFGGGGGGAGGEEEEESIWPSAGGLLEHLTFPTGLPSYTRDWMRYLREMFAKNVEEHIPLPFMPWEGEEGEEESPFHIQMAGLAKSLGLSDLMTKEPEDTTEAYQRFVDAVAIAPFEAQQVLAGLRYTPEAGWFTAQIPQLARPEYL